MTIKGNVKSAIQKGYLILLGICEEDTSEDIDWLVRKVIGLRVFEDENGVMNRSIMDVEGEILVISQFTLFASYKKGNRPSWLRAAKHEISIPLYNEFCSKLSEALGKEVGTGEFGADMKVELLNDGPVTICMDTKIRNKNIEIMEKSTLDRIVRIISIIAVITYIVRRFVDFPNAIATTALSVWGLCIIYQLTKWKENKTSDNYYNVLILILIFAVIFLGI